MQTILNDKVNQYRAEFDRLFQDDVAQFNRRLREQNMFPVITKDP